MVVYFKYFDFKPNLNFQHNIDIHPGGVHNHYIKSSLIKSSRYIPSLQISLRQIDKRNVNILIYLSWDGWRVALFFQWRRYLRALQSIRSQNYGVHCLFQLSYPFFESYQMGFSQIRRSWQFCTILTFE